MIINRIVETHDVSELVHRNLPLPEFYIQHLLAKEGTMMIYGGAGVRKSWLAEHLGFCIATGSPWLGFTTSQARVLIVNFEISPIAYAVLRLRPMEARFTLQPMFLFERSPGNLSLDIRESFDRFAADIRPTQPKVIILDCLQGCYSGDENNMERAGVWIRNVGELQQEHQASIIIIQHANKSLLATGMGRVRGTTRFTAWVDTVIHMAEQPTGIQLQFEKYRLSIIPELHNINIEFIDYTWRLRNQGG